MVHGDPSRSISKSYTHVAVSVSGNLICHPEVAQIGRLKMDYGIDTLIPLRTNMDAYHDVMGLTRLKNFGWEPYQFPVARLRGQKDRPKPPVILKRELKRQQTLAARKGLPPSPPLPYSQTLLGIARRLSSWSDCPVPLTAVVNREIDSGGEIQDWVLVTTSSSCSAQQTRATYSLRTSIEDAALPVSGSRTLRTLTCSQLMPQRLSVLTSA